jgi:hypothetical protein
MVPSNAQSGKALIGMADRTRRCSIEIKDADTDAIMIFTAADWTRDELRTAIDQVLGLVGPCRPQTVSTAIRGRR